tara:strand:+ start:390 stop:812 length:423 start_codon:yes stop_codon:yes gene_type:complete
LRDNINKKKTDLNLLIKNNVVMANNIFGEPLIACSNEPITGYFRDGCCNTDQTDSGLHTVCIIVTAKFLQFSKAAGNDLSTPLPQFDFPGLKAGDKWCLCALRWKEALEHNYAPKVLLEATHEKTLDVITLNDLIKYASR